MASTTTKISKDVKGFYTFKFHGYKVYVSEHFLCRFNERKIIKDCSCNKLKVDISNYKDSDFRRILEQFIEKLNYICIDEKTYGNNFLYMSCDLGLIYGNYNVNYKTINLSTLIPFQVLSDKKKENLSHLLPNVNEKLNGVIFKSKSVNNNNSNNNQIYDLIISKNENIKNGINEYKKLYTEYISLKNKMDKFGSDLVIDSVETMKIMFNEEMAKEFGIYLINILQKNNENIW